jgi:pimeloyl-ACP methyl ester carboxylesterase
MKEKRDGWERRTFIPQLSVLISLLLLLSTGAGCGPRRTPDLERIFETARAREGKRPVIVIPGILGSQLINRRTGEVVWPSVFRSSEDGLSLPTTPDLEANRDELDAAKIISSAQFGRVGTRAFGPEVYVYYELLQALQKYVGYREGNWDAPAPDGDRDTFYVFAYDWRRDNVESARLLVRRIEELKRKLNRPDLRFNILAHSMGGLVARYAAMYGDTDLPTGDAPTRPTWAGASGINKIFMIGTPNEGSAEAFSTLLEGYSVTEGLRRRVRLLNKLSREDALTAPSIFQLLPHRHAARFLDEHLQPLELDLYDPAVWKLYGWSPISEAGFRERFVQRKTDTEDPPHEGATLEELDAYFVAVLARARRFHEALDANDRASNPPPVTLFAFGGDCEETLAAPVILRDERRGRWLTLTRPRPLRTPDGRSISRTDVTRAMYGPGDGRVTRQSLLGEELGPERRSLLFNSALPIAYATFVCDLHSELQKNKTLQDNALTLLVSELMK